MPTKVPISDASDGIPKHENRPIVQRNGARIAAIGVGCGPRQQERLTPSRATVFAQPAFDAIRWMTTAVCNEDVPTWQ